MKINVQDDCLIIYVNNKYLDLDEERLEDSLTNLLYKIKKIYNIPLNGYYDTEIYLNDYYGMIISMEKDDIEFIDYYDNQIDMRTSIKKVDFLYLIEDNYYFDLLKNKKIKLYLYKNKIYVQINQQIDDDLMNNIIEHSSIIYKDTELIKTYGKQI